MLSMNIRQAAFPCELAERVILDLIPKKPARPKPAAIIAN